MRGLSLTQPWASLVAIGAKRLETRSWYTSYRGPIAIHAAKAMPREAQILTSREPFWSALYRDDYDPRSEAHLPSEVVTRGWSSRQPGGVRLPRGAIVAVGHLTAVFETVGEEPWYERWPSDYGPLPDERLERAFGDHSVGRYAWLIAGVRPLAEPIPCRGALGVWPVPADVAARLDGVPA